MVVRCKVCGRPLRDEKSIAAGVGPWCQHAQDSLVVRNMDPEELLRLEDARSHAPDRSYREIVDRVFGPSSHGTWKQFRLDLLEALDAGNRIGLGYEESRRRARQAILNAFWRVEAYDAIAMESIALVLVAAIEDMTADKEITEYVSAAS